MWKRRWLMTFLVTRLTQLVAQAPSAFRGCWSTSEKDGGPVISLVIEAQRPSRAVVWENSQMRIHWMLNVRFESNQMRFGIEDGQYRHFACTRTEQQFSCDAIPPVSERLIFYKRACPR